MASRASALSLSGAEMFLEAGLEVFRMAGEAEGFVEVDVTVAS